MTLYTIMILSDKTEYAEPARSEVDFDHPISVGEKEPAEVIPTGCVI
jgi:hypothetical protein